MPYNNHPSPLLNQLFKDKPYQGASPADAAFLFVGLDANYAADIEDRDIFPYLLEYHRDGVQFWRKYGVHHPFLLPEYRGKTDGRRYHQNFAKLGFRSEHAHLVSFVEVLDIPTTGRSSLHPRDLDSNHLAQLHDWIRGSGNRNVFVSKGVLKLLRSTKVFDWLPSDPKAKAILPRLWVGQGVNIFLHLHLSNYGKFQQQMDREAEAVQGMINKYTGAEGMNG